MQRVISVVIGLAVLPALGGCYEKAGAPTAPAKAQQVGEAKVEHEEHDHHAAGPHGGTILEWGGGAYHVEFTVDHDAKSTAIYILGGDAKSAAPIKAEKLLLTITEPPFQVDLNAEPLDGEAAGMSSKFTGRHDNLGIVQEFAGTVSGEVDGTPYAGDFAEEAGEHGHDH